VLGSPVPRNQAAVPNQSAAHPTSDGSAGRPANLPAGAILQARYRVQGVLGIGGMSTVYQARDLRFPGVERLCAIKEMYNAVEQPPLRQMRLATFRREASFLATLTHPLIPRIYDFFDLSGTIYLVLELVHGQDLEALLAAHGAPFAQETVISWGLQLADVLSYLHRQTPEAIIFRDLKPSNIMLRPDDSVALVDFGIARNFVASQKGTMIGTEGYAPPEQYRGIADTRGDTASTRDQC